MSLQNTLLEKKIFLKYRNDPKFSDTQALANSADPDLYLLL